MASPINWPSWWPVIRHDITGEIPLPLQGLCSWYYRGWQIFIVGGTFIDVVASIFVAATTPTSLGFFGFHVMWFLVLPAACFMTWYLPLYSALKRNITINWVIFALGHTAFLVYNILAIIGAFDYTSYIFPGGELGFTAMEHYFSLNYTVAAVACLADRIVWGVGLIYWLLLARWTYIVFAYQVTAIHANKSNMPTQPGTEMDNVKSTSKYGKKKPAPPPSSGIPFKANVGGVDVGFSVDPRKAASVAGKVYSSGAASALAKGSKLDANGNLVVDYSAAKNAAGALHQSGAAADIAAATTVESVGGYDVPAGNSNGKKRAVPPTPPSRGGGTVKKCQVLHEFQGQEQGDLTVRIGDQVTIVRVVNDDWLEGTLNDQTGIFPRKFVRMD